MNKECELINEYTMQEWLDEILSIDEQGEIEYERDENGEIVQLTDHVGRPLFNPYTGEPLPKPIFLQEGTRITAERMNHLEKHICSLYGWKDIHSSAIEYIMIILELEGQVEGGQGTFFDAISDLTPKNIALDTTKTTVVGKLTTGATDIKVVSTKGFSIGDEIHIYDSEKYESNKVVAVTDETTLKVSETANNYADGAFVTRSTVKIDRQNKKFATVAFEEFNVTSKVL